MLSIDTYTQLRSYPPLKFRYKNTGYTLDLVTLPIEPLTAWLKICRKKDQRYSEWLGLALKYKALVELFYPLGYLNQRVTNHIEQSGVLLANNYSTAQLILIHYWEDFIPQTVYDFIDLARACHNSKLYQGYYDASAYLNSYIVKTGLTFDIESQADRLTTNPHDFYLLFNFLNKSKAQELYLTSVKELNLMRRIIDTWREWVVINYLGYKEVQELLALLGFTLTTQLARLLYLIPDDKLEVTDLEIIPKYVRGIEYGITGQPAAVIEAYKVFGLKPNTPLNEVKVKYHQLVKLCHPDLNSNDPTQIQTIKLIEAWKLIKESTLKM